MTSFWSPTQQSIFKDKVVIMNYINYKYEVKWTDDK